MNYNNIERSKYNLQIYVWRNGRVILYYLPPKHANEKLDYMNYFNTLGDKFIAGGDYNAKHVKWGSRLSTTRWKQLSEAVEENNLDYWSSREPTYWPTDKKKIPDILDFCVTKNISRHYTKAENCYDLSSDHSPVIITLSANALKMPSQNHLTNKHTNLIGRRSSI